MRGARLAFTGAFLVILGAVIGLVYPYIVLVAGDEAPITMLRLVIALVSFMLGAFIASAGATLLVGWRLFYVKDTGEEQEGRQGG